ncbi:MAG: TRAP transporter large permease subunit [Betaproteobacteria bacterium]|nr:MAG: TRAP transporter large permease subunit [Betaproteobacteria bacterium]
MEWYYAAALLLGLALGLMLLGLPVAIAFLAANIVSAYVFMGGERGIAQLINSGFGSLTNFALVPIPMFLLMGDLLFHTGLATRFFNATDRLLGNVPARLSFVTLAGGTAIAGATGSSMGSCALLGSLMVPDMMRRGYSKYLSIGPIMGVGGLAVIIPPSVLSVLLATLARSDVGDLLIAGVIPGLVLAAMYGLLIYGWTLLDPKAAPRYEEDRAPARRLWRIVVLDVAPMIAVIVFTVLIMIAGWATPTEAAAVGVFAVGALAAAYRCLTWRAVLKSVESALRVTVMAFLVIFGSSTFAQVLAFSGAGSGLIDYALSLHASPLAMLGIMIGIILFLGCFMDQLSMMLLTAPIFFPLAKTMGFDLTWFGIIMLLALEVGYTTPPFGLLLFVMKGVAPPQITLRDIYLSALPFIGCVLLLIVLIIAFPPLAMWLPGLH